MEGKRSGKVDVMSSASARSGRKLASLRIPDDRRPENDGAGPSYNGGIMTAGAPEIRETASAGRVESALRAPTLQRLIDLAADRPEKLALVGPASARLFVG